MIFFQSKYNILKQKVAPGEIINTRIIKKLSPNKAVAQIKGYNVIIEGESLPLENSEVSFVISGFNNQKRIITMKMLKPPVHKFNEFKLNEFIVNQLLKYKLPVNSFTIQLGYMLYKKYGKINQQHIEKLIQYLKFNNDVDLIFALFNLKLDESVIIKILRILSNISTLIIDIAPKFFKTFEKNKKSDNKSNEILKNLRYNINKGEFINALLKFNNESKNFGILLELYKVINFYSADEFAFFFPLYIDNKIYPVKIKYRKQNSIEAGEDILYLKIEVFLNEGKVVYFLNFINENNILNIRIKSENTDIEKRIRDNISQLVENIQKIKNIKVNIFKKEERVYNNLDLYI